VPNPTDNYGSPRGDSSDQAFIVHHVRVSVFVKLFGNLTPITPSQSFRGSGRYRCSEVSEFSKSEPQLSSYLGKTLENPYFPTKNTLLLTLVFSNTLHVLRENRYLIILRVKATTVSVRLQIYLFALTYTNNHFLVTNKKL
jgi:hypothetical protein